MTRFAANISMMFTELPFLERFAAAAEEGFRGVEYLFPYDFNPDEVAAALRGAGLSQVLFNAPPGDWDSGERGIAALPGRDTEFENGIAVALRYAAALDCQQIHVMAGLADAADEETAERYVGRLRAAADEAALAGRTLLIEPINPYDMPGYFLRQVPQALDLLERIDRGNVRLQLDLYHAQITDGDLTRLIRTNRNVIGHVQVASVPDRHEPDHGETDYPHLFRVLDEVGYTGWIGCEYKPAAGTTEGLGWFKPFRNGAIG